MPGAKRAREFLPRKSEGPSQRWWPLRAALEDMRTGIRVPSGGTPHHNHPRAPGAPAKPSFLGWKCPRCLFFFFFGSTRSLWKFLSQGSILHPCSNLSHGNDDTHSLSCRATREVCGFLDIYLFIYLWPDLPHAKVPEPGIELVPQP